MITKNGEPYESRLVDGENDCGTCPNCKSSDYSRQSLEWEDDASFYECTCTVCKFEWRETFYLKYQEWGS